MSKKAKHRYTQQEADEAWTMFTDDEKEEYRGLAYAGGISTAGNNRIREMDTIAYTRLKEYYDGQN